MSQKRPVRDFPHAMKVKGMKTFPVRAFGALPLLLNRDLQ